MASPGTYRWGLPDPALHQTIRLSRGQDAVLPFAPADGVTAALPADLSFGAGAAARPPQSPGLPLGPGTGITLGTDAGTFTVTLPAALTGAMVAGDGVWEVWTLTGGSRKLLAGGVFRVADSVFAPG